MWQEPDARINLLSLLRRESVTFRTVNTRPTAFCTTCGAALVPGKAFCISCGARVSSAGVPPAAAPGPPPPPPPLLSRPDSGGVAGVLSGAASAAGIVSAVGSFGGVAFALPWQTISRGQTADVAGIARAAAPSLLALTPRPNLRRPAAGLAVTVVMDVVIALLSGGAVNVPMLVMRVVSGAATAVFGMVAGRGGGRLRALTGFTSIVTGVVQLVSLGVAAFGARSDPGSLVTLIPSLVAVASGLVLAVSTAIAGLRT